MDTVMIAITMLVVILMVVTVAPQKTSFVVNVGAQITLKMNDLSNRRPS
jgi:hypothetical protein